MRHGMVASACGLVTAGTLMFGAVLPGHAAITGATVAATQPSWTGKCPLKVSFTGSVTGSPGTQFSITYVRTVNSVVSPIGAVTVTMPASGSIPVNDGFEIGKSTSGVTEEQVWVHNVSGGQADVYSKAAGFSVTCVVDPGKRPNVPPAVTLHPQWVARRAYDYEWVGLAAQPPEQGTGPCPDLCVGWLHIHQSDSLTLFHHNSYYRSFVGYDPAAFTGLRVAKAILTLMVANGSDKCFGGVGRALLAEMPAKKGGTQHLKTPYPNDGDFALSVPLVRQDAGTVAVDVTRIVATWVTTQIRNDGFVLRGKDEDNGSNGNDACTVGFRTNVVLSIEQLPGP